MSHFHPADSVFGFTGSIVTCGNFCPACKRGDRVPKPFSNAKFESIFVSRRRPNPVDSLPSFMDGVNLNYKASFFSVLCMIVFANRCCYPVFEWQPFSGSIPLAVLLDLNY
jgi:hypothetical protein